VDFPLVEGLKSNRNQQKWRRRSTPDTRRRKNVKRKIFSPVIGNIYRKTSKFDAQ